MSEILEETKQRNSTIVKSSEGNNDNAFPAAGAHRCRKYQHNKYVKWLNSSDDLSQNQAQSESTNPKKSHTRKCISKTKDVSEHCTITTNSKSICN